jgi:hypothetical protein
VETLADWTRRVHDAAPAAAAVAVGEAAGRIESQGVAAR